LLPLPAAPFTAAGGIVLRLLLVGRVDPVELAQQSRPFELGWFITAADGAVMGGADDIVGDRVEGGARSLSGSPTAASNACRRAHLFAVDGDTRITSVKPTPQMVQRR
jgi:hypothetical protein